MGCRDKYRNAHIAVVVSPCNKLKSLIPRHIVREASPVMQNGLWCDSHMQTVVKNTLPNSVCTSHFTVVFRCSLTPAPPTSGMSVSERNFVSSRAWEFLLCAVGSRTQLASPLHLVVRRSNHSAKKVHHGEAAIRVYNPSLAHCCTATTWCLRIVL